MEQKTCCNCGSQDSTVRPVHADWGYIVDLCMSCLEAGAACE
jgi:hypothetical protein